MVGSLYGETIGLVGSLAMAQPLPYVSLGLVDAGLGRPVVSYAQANARVGAWCAADPRLTFCAFLEHRLADGNARELERCVTDLNARAAKIHFTWAEVDPFHLETSGLLRVLQDHKTPLLIHPGTQHRALAQVMRSNPNVTFILAHLGLCSRILVDTAATCPNVFLDTAGVVSEDFRTYLAATAYLRDWLNSEDSLVNELAPLLIDPGALAPIKRVFKTLGGDPEMPDDQLRDSHQFRRLLDINLEKLRPAVPTMVLVVAAVIRTVGSRKVLYGSDAPWVGAALNLDVVEKALAVRGSGSEVEWDLIFRKNFENVFR
jgi:predicted TIM-barrel fold metal-dependent hydrolase